ncbi:SseB family protein [Streptomyces sp. NPDC047079]|uniref:SseB family protein n=1 Tax=Streptomyces sp. NPDC047079 TaxID=3154607 RepID=UPI0033D26FC7
MSTPHEHTPSSEARPSEEAQAAAGAAQPQDTAATEAALIDLASGTVLVPQVPPAEGETRPEGAVALPLIEQDDKRFVPVFTSEEALVAAGADPGTAVGVPVAGLAANWPQDDLWLAVDPSTDAGIALPPDVVRALPALSQIGRSGGTGGGEGDTGRSPTA